MKKYAINGSLAAKTPGPALGRTIMREIRCGGMRHSKIANPRINYNDHACSIGPFAKKGYIMAEEFHNDDHPPAYKVEGKSLVSVPEKEIICAKEMLIVTTAQEAQNGLLREQNIFQNRKFYPAVVTFQRKAVIAQAPRWLLWLGGIAYRKSRFLKELCSALDRQDGLIKSDVKPLDQMGQTYYSIRNGRIKMPGETISMCDKSREIPKDVQISVIFDRFWKVKNRIVTDFYLVLTMGPIGGETVAGKADSRKRGFDTVFKEVLDKVFVHLEGISSSLHKRSAHHLMLAIEGRKELKQETAGPTVK